MRTRCRRGGAVNASSDFSAAIMQSKAKRLLFNAIRIGICVGALWIVGRGVTLRDNVTLVDGTSLSGTVRVVGESVDLVTTDGDRRTLAAEEVARDKDGAFRISFGIATAWGDSHKSFLLLALALHFPVVFPQALRFQWLLAAQNITVGYWECVKLSFAGNFLNFATPLGSHAGDAFKAYFASLHTEHKTEAVTTVVLDRIIGLGTLLLVATLIITFGPSGEQLSLLRPYLLIPMGIGVFGGAFYLSPLFRMIKLPPSVLSRIPMIDHLRRMDRAARTLAGHLPVVFGAVFLTVALQALALLAYFAVAVAVMMDAHFGNILEYFTYYYTGTIVQALPGPPQGLGTVELAYRFFFAPYGSASQIVCMALSIRIVVLVCAVPGLLVTLSGSYRPKAEGLEAIEHEMDGDSVMGLPVDQQLATT